MSANLLTGHRVEDAFTLTWVAPPEYALACASLLIDGTAKVRYHQVPSSGKDPLAVIEEGLVGDVIEQEANLLADQSRQSAVQLLLALAGSGRASVDTDTLWALATAANGAYVRFRSMDLDSAGVDMTPGEAASTDVDGALAELLGMPAAPRRGPEDTAWSLESSLCATLSHEAMAVLSGA